MSKVPRGDGSEPALPHFLAEAREAVCRAISEADGAEVLFGAMLDDSGAHIAIVEVLARGNMGAVPALVKRVQRFDICLHNHPNGFLVPSDADLDVASLLGGEGLGFYIIDNLVTRVRIVVTADLGRNAEPVTVEEVRGILGPEGRIAELLPGYEEREGQLELAEGVARALSDRSIGLCEAGTGTGKTFAYLIPSVIWASRNARRVVVSTGTINLQEQIAEKDVPFLQQGFLPRFRAVLVKGRRNYVSLRRASEAAEAPAEDFDSAELRHEVMELVDWARETETGEHRELIPQPSREAWERVESQSDNCLGARCPRFTDCHYYAARRRASKAQILIVNHHLLLADLAVKHDKGSFEMPGVLPPYDRVIVDEAHKLEEIASDYFGVDLSEFGLLRRLGRLASHRKRGRGLLLSVQKKLGELRLEEQSQRKLVEEVHDSLSAEIVVHVRDSQDAVRETFAATSEVLQSGGKREQSWRMRASPQTQRDATIQSTALMLLSELKDRLAVLVARLGAVVEKLEMLPEGALRQLGAPYLEMRASQSRLESVVTDVGQLLKVEDETKVRWIELSFRRGRARVKFRSSPLEVGPLMRRALWAPVGAAVLTSATLRTGEDFDFLRRRLGLDLEGLAAGGVQELTVDSPFDYRRQAILAVPSDHSEPQTDEFIHDTCYAIEELTGLSRGRAFVLFTSHAMLQRARGYLEGPMRERGFELICQGDAARGELLKRFKTLPRAVLFGTDAFWEGVDVPGDALSLVIVVKLPFRVPSDPVQEARTEAIVAAGGNAFLELMLPQAILKLRQGFGRLIRSRVDRGVVVLLDSRVLKRFYGPTVLGSLPPAQRCIGRLQDSLLRELGAFFKEAP